MFRIITIPFDAEREVFADEILNSFCVNKRIIDYKVEFFVNEDKPYWSVFLEYEPVHHEDNSGDATKDMNTPERVLFNRLRDWRRERAEAEGVPVYIIATNRELRDMVKNAPQSLEALKNIKGYGRKKIERYGKDIVTIIKEFYNRK